ncbi:D-sedoheptulose-7-phosphate isomerase [Fictibacillus terranigra]|uniref:SIS domain-containing protein n=1 Tax=Fictibacillus terranigra TaxID=3058424 RepID=A0ABT8E514_9BACL|nr:SIS domain-containing protein [Fictibacillus sp. CENA-BCM004]MDN4072998.1 SIS domain-containing protein [Fictibacillus sp. CENA-BCM004]
MSSIAVNAISQNLVQKYPELVECQSSIEECFEVLKRSFESGGKLLLAGNGGSASDCEHVVGELMKGFMRQRALPAEMKKKIKEVAGGDDYIADHLQGALPAISLVSQTSLMTAFANDIAADMIFAQQVFGYGKANDVFIGFSTSGHSKNIIHAAQVARALDMVTIGFTGRDGGALKTICDITISVPFDATPDIQERHLPVYHALCMMLEEVFFL